MEGARHATNWKKSFIFTEHRLYDSLESTPLLPVPTSFIILIVNFKLTLENWSDSMTSTFQPLEAKKISI